MGEVPALLCGPWMDREEQCEGAAWAREGARQPDSTPALALGQGADCCAVWAKEWKGEEAWRRLFLTSLFFFFKDFISFFVEKGEGRERNIQLAASGMRPSWGPNPRPRRMP